MVAGCKRANAGATPGAGPIDDSAAVYSPLTLALYDAWVLQISNRYAWRCPTRTELLPFWLFGDGLAPQQVHHHTFTRLSGARYSASPGLTPNAAYQPSRLSTCGSQHGTCTTARAPRRAPAVPVLCPCRG